IMILVISSVIIHGYNSVCKSFYPTHPVHRRHKNNLPVSAGRLFLNPCICFLFARIFIWIHVIFLIIITILVIVTILIIITILVIVTILIIITIQIVIVIIFI